MNQDEFASQSEKDRLEFLKTQEENKSFKEKVVDKAQKIEQSMEKNLHDGFEKVKEKIHDVKESITGRHEDKSSKK